MNRLLLSDVIMPKSFDYKVFMVVVVFCLLPLSVPSSHLKQGSDKPSVFCRK